MYRKKAKSGFFVGLRILLFIGIKDDNLLSIYTIFRLLKTHVYPFLLDWHVLNFWVFRSSQLLLCFLALFSFSCLHLASALFLCTFIIWFHTFCSNFILKSIGQATTTLACRPRMSHCRASTASTHIELLHLLRSFISRLISNFNFKNRSFLLTSFQTYEVTWASYVDSTLHTKNPNQVSIVPSFPLFFFQPHFSIPIGCSKT